MARIVRRKERRLNDKMTFMERRKGKFWMYSQLIISTVLILCLLCLLWLLK